ncbi:DUF3560 domain-containing protein [Rhodopseudomonas palustris]|nr:DUF3560 domain-containing protein [Rhodopseudomonas palustris]WBU32344.1 DUF3560 domain-containing protein [Rhodopseudomonas palustris]
MTATYSPDDNKLRLYASKRLGAETFARVKAAGFKYAPKQDLFVAPSWSPEREDLLLELCGEIGDEDSSLVDRAEERADRFENYGEKRLAEAEAARKAVAEIADGIQLGQPILVGHHSERHARRDAERIESGMRRAVKLWRTSEYWTRRAAGALHHAKYKELPAVRHRRIKGIEADRRKVERSKAESEKWLKLWTAAGAETEPERQLAFARKLANVSYMTLPKKEVDREDMPSGPSAWTALSDDPSPGVYAPRTAAEVISYALSIYPESIERAARWLQHYDNRLAYERAMLAEQIGGAADGAPVTMGDRFPFAVGGKVQVSRSHARSEWLTILRVNRTGGTVNSLTTEAPAGVHWQKTWKFSVEDVTAYEAPSAAAVEQAKEAAKLPPLCNYPGEGFAHMTKDEYEKVPKSYRGYRELRKLPDGLGRHRTRVAIGAYAFRGKCDDNKRHSYHPVFITDAKRVDPPAAPAPAEPTTPAEFVAAIVAPPSVAKAERATAAEIDTAAAGSPADAPIDATPSAAPSCAADAPRVLGSAQDEAERAGAEIIMGLGQYRVGRGAVVTGWHDAAAGAWREFCGLAGLAFSEDLTPPARPRAAPGATADFAAPSRAADFEAMAAALRSGQAVQVVAAPQLFATPRDIAAEAAELLDLKPGQRLLEPNAGTGALIEAARAAVADLEIVAVEINPRLAGHLRERFPGMPVHCGDFLSFDPPAERFDRVLMNSPFENGADIKHIEHARRFMKPGGRLVAICANGPRQRARLMPIASTWRDLPAGSFKSSGTMVNAALLVIEAPPAPVATADLAGAELLDRTKLRAPGFYTERDGGDWYIVTPDHGDRIGEGFVSRDAASRMICWLAGDLPPSGWRIEAAGDRDLFARVLMPGQPPATLWLRAARQHFIGAAALAGAVEPEAAQ